MSTGTLGPFGYRIRLLERRGDADDVSRRRCALRRPDSVSCGLFGRPRTMSSSPSGVPVVLRLPDWSGYARQAKNQGRFTPTLVKAATLPRPGTSPSRRPRAHALGGPRGGRGACRRSLDDALDGATRTVTRSLPAISGSSRARSRLGAGTWVLRAAFVRPSRRRIGARCHEGGAPLHASCETTTRVGTRARSKLRAARVSCSMPKASGRRAPSYPHWERRVLDDETTDTACRDCKDARSLARCCHRSSDAPVGSQRVEGCWLAAREPRLDLSRTPQVTHRTCTQSEPDVHGANGP